MSKESKTRARHKMVGTPSRTRVESLVNEYLKNRDLPEKEQIDALERRLKDLRGAEQSNHPEPQD